MVADIFIIGDHAEVPAELISDPGTGDYCFMGAPLVSDEALQLLPLPVPGHDKNGSRFYYRTEVEINP